MTPGFRRQLRNYGVFKTFSLFSLYLKSIESKVIQFIRNVKDAQYKTRLGASAKFFLDLSEMDFWVMGMFINLV